MTATPEVTPQEQRIAAGCQALLDAMDSAARAECELLAQYQPGLRLVPDPERGVFEVWWTGRRIGALSMSWVADGEYPDEWPVELRPL